MSEKRFHNVLFLARRCSPVKILFFQRPNLGTEDSNHPCIALVKNEIPHDSIDDLIIGSAIFVVHFLSIAAWLLKRFHVS